jgi:monomeric isocitrate dehydrogenase
VFTRTDNGPEVVTPMILPVFQAFSKHFGPSSPAPWATLQVSILSNEEQYLPELLENQGLHSTLCNFCQINSSRLSKVESRDCQIPSLAASARPGGCLTQSRLRKQPNLLSSFGQTDPILA